jgi:hypothetical protein
MVASSFQASNLNLKLKMKFIIGAYTTAPSLAVTDKSVEYRFYENLIESIPDMRGLEIPFWGKTIHQFGSDFLLDIINPSWENVLSCIPATMSRLVDNPKFGLASNDEFGRSEAVKMHKRANQILHKINQRYGKKSVLAVEIATAPSVPVLGVLSSKESLLKSMEEILMWDWQGSKIVIEHCDSAIKGVPFEKGFLAIEEEIQALVELKDLHNVGLTINWARSAIEGRSEDKPLEHIKLASNCNLLSGLMFSGVSDNDNHYGIWKDLHMPFSQYKNSKYHEKNSLLSHQNIVNCINQADPNNLDYLGVKLLSLPVNKSGISRRVGVNKEATIMLSDILDGR